MSGRSTVYPITNTLMPWIQYRPETYREIAVVGLMIL